MRKKRRTATATQNVTFQSLISEKITMMKNENKPSFINYQSLLSNLNTEFGPIFISDFNSDFTTKWKAKMKKDGISDSTIAFRFTLCKAIYHYAVYKGYASMDDFPFQRHSYELDKPKTPAIAKRTECYLTREEMTKLYKYWLTMSEKKHVDRVAKKYLALFLMSYLCNGANAIDLMKMKYCANYQRSGGQCLYFVRSKVAERTGAKVVIPLIEPLKKILEHIGGDVVIGRPVLSGYFINGYDMNNIDDVRLNCIRLCSQVKKTLKPIFKKIIGVDHCSMTYARHSYSTVLHNLGAPHHIIERNLGHACNDIAFNYIGATPTKKLFEINNLLLDL